MNKLYYLFMGILFITIMNSCSNEDVVPSIESHSWAEDIFFKSAQLQFLKLKICLLGQLIKSKHAAMLGIMI